MNPLEMMKQEPHPMDTLKVRTNYERLEDMSHDGKLGIFIESDGDVIVVVTQGESSHDKWKQASVQFCTPCSGGGQSPKVRHALLLLAMAIKEENETAPQNRV